MKKIKIDTDFITLTQLLKIENIISSGGEAKYFLSNNTEIEINNEIDNRRGRKLYPNDIVKILEKEYLITK